MPGENRMEQKMHYDTSLCSGRNAMKKICAMGGVIFDCRKPGPSIRQLREAGIHGIMFDFGLFLSPEWAVRELEKEEGERQLKPSIARKQFREVLDDYAAHAFLPSVARLPFIDMEAKTESGRLNDLLRKIAVECVRTCEQIGCEEIIVQPLLAGIRKEELWETNRAFFLSLADVCAREETRILLTNQCHSYHGHLVRGACSDGEEAARWVDALNRETGRERFGFCLDTGVCGLCRQDIQEMVRPLGKRIRAVILTENNGYLMSRLLPFTNVYGRQSAMDWMGAVRGLRESGFDGWLILETTDTTVTLPPMIQPVFFPVYKAYLDYFSMQIRIENDLRKYEQVVLFGAGNMCRNYMKCYGEKYPPLFTCDNNEKLWGSQFEGLTVKSPEELKTLPENCGVIICNMYYREIEAQLRAMGIQQIGYFSDAYMPSLYFDRLERKEEKAEKDK